MACTEYLQLLGVLLVVDPIAPLHSSLVAYTTSANLSIAYNLGAIGGTMYMLQVASGVVIAMSYVASEDHSFSALDRDIHSHVVSGIQRCGGY